MINKGICNISEKELYQTYKIFFGTLVSKSRLKIINLLRKEEKNVSEIKKELKTEQTTISHDLKRLKDCGFVEMNAKGKFRYYKLNKKTINPLMDIIDNHMKKNCIHILNKRLKRATPVLNKKYQIKNK